MRSEKKNGQFDLQSTKRIRFTPPPVFESLFGKEAGKRKRKVESCGGQERKKERRQRNM
jgi:hypothetical protein